MSDVRRVMLEMWLNGDRPRSGWRQQARGVMCRVIEPYLNTHGEIDDAELLGLVDAAYPFGPRSHQPYKAWLTERSHLREILDAENQPDPPTDEDYAACEVAIDLVETEQVDAARKLLDEQAPRRLNRACPACSAKPGKPCFTSFTDKWLDEQTAYLVVPHLARVAPSKTNGPLFGGQP